MPTSRQLLLALIPYVITVALLAAVVQPKLAESQLLSTQISEKKDQYEMLAGKIKAKEKLLLQEKKLNSQIRQLESSLPKEPEIDLLLLDMEKMSDEAGVEILGLELEDEGTKKGKSNDLMQSLLSEVEGKLPLSPMQAKSKKPAKPVAAAKKNAAKEENQEDNEYGLKRVVRRVFIAGDYENLNSFMKRLEAYRRVVGVRELIVALPQNEDREVLQTKASERGKKLELEKPIMTFLMSIYYLP